MPAQRTLSKKAWFFAQCPPPAAAGRVPVPTFPGASAGHSPRAHLRPPAAVRVSRPARQAPRPTRPACPGARLARPRPRSRSVTQAATARVWGQPYALNSALFTTPSAIRSLNRAQTSCPGPPASPTIWSTAWLELDEPEARSPLPRSGAPPRGSEAGESPRNRSTSRRMAATAMSMSLRDAEPPEAQAQRALGELSISAEGAQHVGGLGGCRIAGRSG